MFLPLLIALAATATITPIETPKPTEIPTTNTSEEIQKLREVVSQKVAEKLRQITNPASTKKAFTGKIIQIDTSSISIDYQNNPKTITISPDTVYVDIKGSKTKLANIKVGQDILIMGNNDASNFTAKRIVLINPSNIFYKRTVVVGKIVDVSRTSPIFSLIPTKNKNDLYQIKTDTKTEILDSKHQKIKSADLKSGQRIIAILTPDVKVSKTYNAVSLIDLDFTPATSPTPVKK